MQVQPLRLQIEFEIHAFIMSKWPHAFYSIVPHLQMLDENFGTEEKTDVKWLYGCDSVLSNILLLLLGDFSFDEDLNIEIWMQLLIMLCYVVGWVFKIPY